MPSAKQDQGVSQRYAQGLMGAVLDEGVLEDTAAELPAVAALVRENVSLRAFLEGPNIPTENKVELLRKTLSGRITPMLLEFLGMLLRKDRIGALAEIAATFQKLVEERRNQLRAKVISAVALKVDALDRLKRALDASTGKECILELEVDAAILGGLIVVLDDRVIDGSIRTALDDLRKQLLAAPV